MRLKLVVSNLSICFVVCIVTLICAGVDTAGEVLPLPSIEGTYKLIWRELPDGTKQRYPDVLGLMTYTKEYRNFNVYWRDAEGKAFSVSYMATYKLTEKDYSEKSVYRMVNDQIGGKRLSYDLSGPSGTSPVSIKEGRIEFQLPLYDEPSVAFEGARFTASKPGVFVDFWEKVK